MIKETPLLLLAIMLPAGVLAESSEQRVSQVAETDGLIAFWDFALTENGRWTSYHDDHVVDHGYPVTLRRIGDSQPYTSEN